VLNQKLTFSPAYYVVAKSGNALKSHIISAGLSLQYLEICMFISIYQTAVQTVSHAKFAKEAFDL
jgi:hypothetical protein